MPGSNHDGATYEGDQTKTLSGGAVAAAAHMAAWPASEWKTLLAVAYAESSWRPGIVYRLADGRGMHGLMQINDDAHPVLIQSGNPADPVANMRMALKIYRDAGNSWRPWEGYTNGNYRQYLAKAEQGLNEHLMAHRAAGDRTATGASSTGMAADKQLLRNSGYNVNPVGGGYVETVGDNAAVANLQAAIDAITNPVNWVRFGMVVAGAMAIGVGLFWLVRSSKPVNDAMKAVVGTVGEVIPVGKIGKAVGKVANVAEKAGKVVNRGDNSGNGEVESS